MATPTTTTAFVRRILQITAASELLTDAEIAERIAEAVEMFSKDKPRELQLDTAGQAESKYALPTTWVDRFSHVLKIELPGSEEPLSEVDENDYRVVEVDDTQRTIDNASAAATSITLSTAAQALFYTNDDVIEIGDDNASETNWAAADGNSTTGVLSVKTALSNTYNASPYVKKVDYLYLQADTPATSEFFTLHYTAPHTLSASVDTIPSNDYEAFANLCAALCCYSIAAEFAKSQDSSFTADAVDYGAKSAEWQNRGDKYMELYNAHVSGKDDGRVKGASGIKDLDQRYSHGRKFLFHGQRTR